MGSELKNDVFMAAKGCDSSNYLSFLKNLSKEVKRSKLKVKPYLVLDNHPSHFSQYSRDILLENFIPIF